MIERGRDTEITGLSFGSTEGQHRDAVQHALVSVAKTGVGMVHEVFDPVAAHKTYQENYPDHLGRTTLLDEVELFRPVVNTLKHFAVRPPLDGMTQPPCVGPSDHQVLQNTKPSEYWHVDTSTEAPGLRLTAQLRGPDSDFLASKSNDDFFLDDEYTFQPKRGASFYRMAYRAGSIVLIAEKRLLVLPDGHESPVPIDHPIHTGISNEFGGGNRMLLVSDIPVWGGTYLSGMGVGLEQIRPFAAVKV